MPNVALPDGNVCYREKGSGPALVLLMGAGADHTSWARQFTPLSVRFRVIAPDNRGAGRSLPSPPTGWTTADFARETLAFLDLLGVERFHVAGFSFGAAVATEVALAAPDRVVAASFHSGWAGPNDRTTAALERSLARLGEDGVASYLEAACRRNFSPAFQTGDPAAFEAFVRNVAQSKTRPEEAGVRAQAEAGLAHDARDRLATLTMPVLVTTGEHDPLAGPPVAEDFARRIPGARLSIFRGPRAYHAIPLEMADAFNAALIDFHVGPT
jgi:pimeloyl-ACP methyl ester carboxylesterase